MVVFYQRGVIICSPTSSFRVHPWFPWSRQSMFYALCSPDFSDQGNQCYMYCIHPWFLWSRQSMHTVFTHDFSDQGNQCTLYSPMISLIKAINAHCVHPWFLWSRQSMHTVFTHDFSDQGINCTVFTHDFSDQGNQCTLYSPMISLIKALRNAHGTVAFNHSWIIRHVLTTSHVHAINSTLWLADQLLCSLALNFS